MSQKVREEMLPRLRQRYGSRGREGRSRLIDEVVEQFGYSRKHAIKLLGARTGWGGDPSRRKGRPPVYGPEVVEVLHRLWKVAEQPCGKRLVALVGLWLPYYQRRYGKLSKRVHGQVLAISAAQVDRLLRGHKAGARGRCATRPGGLIKSQIPIRGGEWEVDRPGYLEADTVAHCGQSMAGEFVWSATYTDIFSTWTVTRAVWNRLGQETLDRTREVEATLPFEILGFDCDNGGEFLNAPTIRYFLERARPVEFTRSRPYHKDDNGHVEQKNWTRVRQLLGYGRIEEPEAVERLNRLYREVWDPLHNFFLPSVKLEAKEREGAKVRRRHDRPLTPCERLLRSQHVSAATKARLRQSRGVLNPFELKDQLEEGLRQLLHRPLRSSRLPGSLHYAGDGAKCPQSTVS